MNIDRVILPLIALLIAIILGLFHYPATAALFIVFAVVTGFFGLTNREEVRITGAWFSLGGLAWSREDYLRHWICVGKSGCGKTLAFIRRHAAGFLRAAPNGGAVLVDEKGDFRDEAEMVLKAQGRLDKFRLLRVALPTETKPPTVTFNLVGDRTIPFATHAQLVADVAVSQGQKTSQAFFKTAAIDAIEAALEALYITDFGVTLENAYDFFYSEELRLEVLSRLEEGEFTDRRDHLTRFWKEYLTQDAGQKSGVDGTCRNFLKPYKTPAIAEVFCAANPTSTFADLDKGFWLCPSIPQVYLKERRYITAFFKIGFYVHGLRRFDQDGAKRDAANELTLYADEGQNSILAGEDGLTDINTLDKLRAAKCCVVFAMQSYSSAVPPIESKDKAEVLFTNLNNHVIFALNDETGRRMASDNVGKGLFAKISRTTGKGATSTTRTEEERAVYPTYFFRKLRKFHCLLIHCEGTVKKTVLPPVEPDGFTVSRWYYYRFFTALSARFRSRSA